MNPCILSVLLFMALQAGGLWAAEPPRRPEPIPVRSLYEGVIPYALHVSRCYVRTDAEADKRLKYNREFSEREFGPFSRTPEVVALHRAIGVRVGSNPRSEEVWEAARCILGWHWAHSRYDPDQYDVLMRSGPQHKDDSSAGEWPKVEAIARYYARHQELPFAACFSEAHLVFQLFRVCGLPSDDFGIASARYMKDKEGKQLREHVYLGLRVGGEWYYLDPAGPPMAPYAKRASIGRKVGEGPGCDYAHPFLFKTVAGARFQGAPLLEPRPSR